MSTRSRLCLAALSLVALLANPAMAQGYTTVRNNNTDLSKRYKLQCLPPLTCADVGDLNATSIDLSADIIDGVDLADTLDFDADWTWTQGAGEQLIVNKSVTDGAADEGWQVNYTALDTASAVTTQYAVSITNQASTEAADALLELDNADADDNVVAGILFTNPARFSSHMTVGNAAMTLGDATMDSLTVTTDGTGDGELVFPTGSVGAAEILDLTRSIALPTNGWFPCADGVWDSAGADTEPDLALVNSAAVIEYDATGGSVDTGEICTSFMVPQDYASGGTFSVRATQGGATGANVESFSCRISVDGAAIGAANSTNLANQTAVQTVTVTPAGTWAAGASIGAVCRQGNGSADDAVNFLAIEARYTATQ